MGSKGVQQNQTQLKLKLHFKSISKKNAKQLLFFIFRDLGACQEAPPDSPCPGAVRRRLLPLWGGQPHSPPDSLGRSAALTSRQPLPRACQEATGSHLPTVWGGQPHSPPDSVRRRLLTGPREGAVRRHLLTGHIGGVFCFFCDLHFLCVRVTFS